MRVPLIILALTMTGVGIDPAGATPPPAATSGSTEAASTSNSPTTGGGAASGAGGLSGAPDQATSHALAAPSMRARQAEPVSPSAR